MTGTLGSEAPKKLTLREKKKAQPLAKLYFSAEEKKSIINTVARSLDAAQVGVFFYTCQALGLNPLLNEVCAVTYKDKFGKSTMSIQVMRDGFLTIAHRSGKFAGLESGVNVDESGKIISGWAKVYHKDFDHPVHQEADFGEYNTGKNLWATKPKTMIKKVAESMALRKAFNVSGVYASEEMEKEIDFIPGELAAPTTQIPNGDKPATEIQVKTMMAMDKDLKKEDLIKLTRQEAADKLRTMKPKKERKA